MGFTILLLPFVLHTLHSNHPHVLAQMLEEGQEQNSGRTGSLLIMKFLFSPRTQNISLSETSYLG